MSNLPPPPVPQKLQEMLKDYPELIQELQDTLDSYAKKPNTLQPFDGAIWILEDTLGSFMSDAHEELKAAEAKGDAEAIARAKEKDFTMGSARSKGRWIDDDGLWEYFQKNGEAL